MHKPILNLIYYKALLDVCMLKFINFFENDFKKQNDQYVFCLKISDLKLKNIFKTFLIEELKKIIKEYSILNPEYFLIINGCFPENNILLNYKDDTYFPKKLNMFIKSDLCHKYILKDKSIKIDLLKFNKIFNDIFLEFFKDQKKLISVLDLKYNNVFFIQNSNIDCYSLFKIIKHLYGKNNCNNLYLAKYKDIKPLFIAINDLINKYINKKTEMCKSENFKKITIEIKQFIDQKISQVLNNG